MHREGAGEDRLRQAEHLFHLGRAEVGLPAEEVVEVVLVDGERRLVLRPPGQPLPSDGDQLWLEERDRSGHLCVHGLGTSEPRDGGGVRRLDGVSEECVRKASFQPYPQGVAGSERLHQHERPLAEPPLERRHARKVAR